MRYLAPAVTANEMALVRPPPESSFAASSVSESRALPEYAASMVSNALPSVFMRTVPDDGAVHVNHTDARPVDEKCSGSPVSRVAPAVVVTTLPLAPVIAWLLAKASFAGAVAVLTGGTGAPGDASILIGRSGSTSSTSGSRLRRAMSALSRSATKPLPMALNVSPTSLPRRSSVRTLAVRFAAGSIITICGVAVSAADAVAVPSAPAIAMPPRRATSARGVRRVGREDIWRGYARIMRFRRFAHETATTLHRFLTNR